MSKHTKRLHWIALFALLLVFAACKGESPTAPPPGGGGPPGGGTPPAGSDINITVTASATQVEVNNTVQISATVTQGGQPVPNGTAVEFRASRGTFADSGQATTLRITTNGVATASLSSATAGTSVVTVTVGNVSRQSPTITFTAAVVPEPQPNTDPTITGVEPAFGRPAGGEIIRILGTNFRGRVRVFFDLGENTPREAQVVSVTPTAIEVISPAVQLAAGQTLAATISVIVDADTPNSVRLTAPTPFTYRTQQLTPNIITVSPNSGDTLGGTRVTIFGDNFQAPVQVLFGAAEARVLETHFDKIFVETPTAREALAGAATIGTVGVTVINIDSDQRDTVEGAFRYSPLMDVTGFTPLTGSAFGGTEITINGFGFDGRMQVLVGGIEAQVIRVAGTQLLVRTNARGNPCASATGPILVRNLDTGATASSDESFSYVGVAPLITAVADTTPADPLRPGEAVLITVQNPGIGPLGSANIRFTINGVALIPSPATITEGTGTQTFTVALPTSGFTFPTVSCTVGTPPATGTQLGTVDVAATFTNLTTTCTDTLAGAVRVSPPGPNPCVVPPAAVVAPSGVDPNCATAAATIPSAGTTTGTAQFTVTNTGGQNLNITSATVVAGTTNATTATVSPASGMVTPSGPGATFTITIDPAAAGPVSGTVRLNTNDPLRPTIDVCFRATGT